MGLSQKELLAAVERSQNKAIKKGSDPGAATCRGKLQYRRSRLNVDINKHLLLRQGAENLLRAAENKKVRQAVSLELSFLNSNLQFLKEELSDLNSSVDVYQNDDSKLQHIPMIPFGLKETNPIDFTDAFKEFIAEHYHEDPEPYIGVIKDFIDTRQAMRTPQRSSTGLALLFEYYNQLYFIERRLFPPDRHLGVYFEWYDSLTGLPSCQRTMAFEKASVLFNIAALHSQLGAKEARTCQKGLDTTIGHYLRAAGIYRYILENFSNAPSRDLDPDVLEVLTGLLTAQAGECRLERLLLEEESAELAARLEMGREAAQVSEMYRRLGERMTPMSESSEESVPPSWQDLVNIKAVHYSALAHNHLALGRCHLREAITQHEEALRLYRMSRGLKKQESLLHVLRVALELAAERQAVTQREDDFDLPVEPPAISGGSARPLAPRSPEFGRYPMADPLHRLGPLETFSAHHRWSPPREVTVSRRPGEPLGFSLKREAPVVVVDVEQDGAAQRAGLKDGDYIVAMGEQDLKWSGHSDVVDLLRKAGTEFSVTAVTPQHRAAQQPKSPPATPDGSWDSVSSSGVSSAAPSRKQSPAGSVASTASKTAASRRLSWNPFRRATRSDSGSGKTRSAAA
ncbi:Rhophilin-2 [Amphibalanus amphitrite]|uniref:Rhophilin-2 n=1 Tax=Amphibalanus amphitrite TaxID=1232801 RepID=A0A6A4X653_AMPAM|nr:Rhophilin-2 [Amphibalanus amphitrite]KAF0311590.1 Rhophilin-2 [Amphibalanus amphitrite]